MNQYSEINCDTGFLPTAKLRMLPQCKIPKQKPKRKTIEQQKSIQKSSEEIEITELIEQYYRRFKIQTIRTIPYSVNINFKSVAEQEMRGSLKSQEYKLRNFQLNKIRSHSQGASSERINPKKSREKINCLSKIMMNQIKMESKVCKKNDGLDMTVTNKQNSISKVKRLPILSFQQVFTDKNIKEPATFNAKPKQNISKTNKNMIIHPNPNPNPQKSISRYAALSKKKKYQHKQKVMKDDDFKLPKRLTPWLNQYCFPQQEQFYATKKYVEI